MRGSSGIQAPNILFIMADQLAPMLTGAYGHPVVQTPHLDRLAREGVRFDAAYSPCPVCGPARASLMTGKYASSIGAWDNAAPLPVDEPTFAHYLSLAGYDTVLSGKMHFVGADQLHGFRRRLVSNIYPADFSWTPNRGVEPADEGAHALDYQGDAIRVGGWSRELSYDEETHFRALEYLRSRSAAGETAPFMLTVSYHHPHEPFLPPKAYWDLYEGEDIPIPKIPDDVDEHYSTLDRWLNTYHGLRKATKLRDPDSLRRLHRAYYALVTYIDDKVGELLSTLEQTGQAENTVVVFSSDHGDMLGSRGMVQKRAFYEWSARVPLIMRFADRAHAGKTIETPCSLIDLLPTFLRLGPGGAV